MKHYFLCICIIIFQKKSVERKQLHKNKDKKKNSINRPSMGNKYLKPKNKKIIFFSKKNIKKKRKN
jgi:hypothetical protein